MNLPLLFSFRQIVMGNGFVAGVRMCGRALLEEEDGETWITGVAPVGLAGGGMDRTVAFNDFRQGWAGILFDIAGDSASFADFKRQAEEFLASSSEDLTRRWDAALAHVRNSGYADRSLPSESADAHVVSFDVVELTHYSADDNEVEAGLKAAA